jgi:hypothetical protein
MPNEDPGCQIDWSSAIKASSGKKGGSGKMVESASDVPEVTGSIGAERRELIMVENEEGSEGKGDELEHYTEEKGEMGKQESVEEIVSEEEKDNLSEEEMEEAEVVELETEDVQGKEDEEETEGTSTNEMESITQNNLESDSAEIEEVELTPVEKEEHEEQVEEVEVMEEPLQIESESSPEIKTSIGQNTSELEKKSKSNFNKYIFNFKKKIQ